MATDIPRYDLLLKGGHVIDPANDVEATMDVAVRDGVVAAVSPDILGERAASIIDVSGFYVTPGIIDIHTHVYRGIGLSVAADPLAVRGGVTTQVDAGSSGCDNFGNFKDTVIDIARTRVLVLLNIARCGMTAQEQNLAQMDPIAAAETIAEYPEHIVGLKSAHYMGAGFEPIDHAVHAGRLNGTPVMVDFWVKPTATYEDLLLKHLRPGDMHTHIYARQFPLLDDESRVQDYVWEARKRGVLFDLGHGGGSFWFRIAAPAITQGFGPDSISTDLHRSSALLPAATMDVTMSKLLNLGLPLPDVIRRSTMNPARQIQRPQLGTLSVGSPADIAVFSLHEGEHGFIDSGHTKMRGTRRLVCQLTFRDGQVLWDLEGISCPDWDVSGDYDYIDRPPLPRHDWPA